MPSQEESGDQYGKVGKVEVEHPRHLHEIAISRQALLNTARMVVWVWSISACDQPLELHGFSIPGDPHGWLLQAVLDHIGSHGSIHHQAGP